jgi:hypothetical protein
LSILSLFELMTLMLLALGSGSSVNEMVTLSGTDCIESIISLGLGSYVVGLA